MSDKLGKEKWTIERMTMEAAEDSTPDYNESTVPPKNNPGRTFRDGVRKIDLILVVKDEENIITDTMKNNFLTNIVKTGFEIEFEKGVLPINKKLVFFKVHCPNDVLNNLGNAYGIKCLQIARAEHIMSYNEREWINLIRKQYTQPLQYSSLERSLVVYMTLLNVPFGDRQNYIGLERLMKRNIVIDAYALHDGPYFITQDATNINARQILFYNWVGFRNIFTRQPLNVVHEYFGPKVAMYFVYFGLYNIFLAIASIGALTTLFLAVFLNENYMDLRTEICNRQNESICFDCMPITNGLRCYYDTIDAFCYYYKINVLIDNKYAPYFAAFILLWGMCFTSYWYGREKYFNWIWEARNKFFNRKLIRPEFELNVDTSPKSNKTGIVVSKHRDYKIKTLLCYIAVILLDAFIFVVFARRPKNYFWYGVNGLIIRAIVVTIGFVIVLLIIDFIYGKVASYIVRMENHKSYASCSRSLAKQQYIMCLPVPLMVLFSYGYHPAVFDFEMQRGYRRDGYYLQDHTCMMTSCGTELFVAFSLVLVLRYVIFKKLSLYSSVTDYNQRAIVETVPCWEREFVLPRFDENILANKMTILVIQLTLIMSFGFGCPPAILIVLFFNMYYMRRDAELCTLYYRRPLLLKNNSFDIWTKILKLMVYLAIVVNILSNYIYVSKERQPGGVMCYTRTYIHLSRYSRVDRDALTNDELKTYQYMYIVIFEILMAAIFLILQYIFSIDVDEKEIPKKRERENYDESRSNSGT
ncbi:PREDICTED: anoctamin-9-like isoform X2 [Papilio xuthus]|uniref:Anoctamin n=1 Tax=Papilio xuthus TaxID=66420 RepID=A0AAJ6Z7D6_PAPXU|nr:PREDICTED: anoctamin-9-like isoform X2 [Papilio xuthus]